MISFVWFPKPRSQVWIYTVYIYIYRNWSIALLYYGGGDSHCYVCLCLFCREDDVNELENKKSSARKQWVRPIFQDRFSATFFQALFFISRSLNSLEVVSYKTGNRFGESRHIYWKLCLTETKFYVYSIWDALIGSLFCRFVQCCIAGLLGAPPLDPPLHCTTSKVFWKLLNNW